MTYLFKKRYLDQTFLWDCLLQLSKIYGTLTLLMVPFLTSGQQRVLINEVLELNDFVTSNNLPPSNGIATSEGLLYTGHHFNGNDYDLVVKHYKRDGSELWNAHFNGGGDDYGVRILHSESSGKTWVVGVTETGLRDDLLILQFNQYGEEEWHVTWKSRTASSVRPLDAVLYGDELYVIGESTTTERKNLFAVRATDQGLINWSLVYGEPGAAMNPVGMEVLKSKIVIALNETNGGRVMLGLISNLEGAPAFVLERIDVKTIRKVFDVEADPFDRNHFYITGNNKEGENANVVALRLDQSLLEKWCYEYDHEGRKDVGMKLVAVQNKVLVATQCTGSNGIEVTRFLHLNKGKGSLIHANYWNYSKEKSAEEFIDLQGGYKDGVTSLVRMYPSKGQQIFLGIYDDVSTHREEYALSQDGSDLTLHRTIRRGDDTYVLGNSTRLGENRSMLIFLKSRGFDEIIHNSYDNIDQLHLNRLNVVLKENSATKSFINNTRLEYGTVEDVLQQSHWDYLKRCLKYPELAYFKKRNRYEVTSDTFAIDKWSRPVDGSEYAYHIEFVFSEFETSPNPWSFFDLWKCVARSEALEYSMRIIEPTLHSSIQEGQPDEWLKIAPNPVIDKVEVTIQDEFKGPYRLEVYDMNGALMFNENIVVKVYSIDLSHLPPGVYSIKVQSVQGDFHVEKVIKL